MCLSQLLVQLVGRGKGDSSTSVRLFRRSAWLRGQNDLQMDHKLSISCPGNLHTILLCALPIHLTPPHLLYPRGLYECAVQRAAD